MTRPGSTKKLSSKWTQKKYSRLERRRRKLTHHEHTQTRITAFSPLLTKIEAVLKKNEDMIKTLTQELAKRCSDYVEESAQLNVSRFLRVLMDTARKNNERELHGKRYMDEVKLFSTYLFITAGRMVYEFLYLNLKNSLPSSSTVEKFMAVSLDPVKEGYLRVKELKEYLEVRNLPKKVSISEDGTRIVSKFLYNPASDQIVGPALPLLPNGMPQVDSFPATSAAVIAHHFLTAPVSGTAYVFMAQPLAKGASPFCLLVTTTDNKFNASHVKNRFEFIETELKKEGIDVVCFSSDGDAKLLSGMIQKMFPKGITSHAGSKWFHCDKESPVTFVQDTIHVVNKFKTRLVKPSVNLPIGDFVASAAHLQMVIKDDSKLNHGLTSHDLQKQDKMNFTSSKKICSERVIQSLQNIPGTEGTVAYLNVMRDTLDSFLDTGIPPLQRVLLIWRSLFFLVIWKHWIISSKGLTLTNNFITTNLFLCILLNAHSLVKLLMYLRDNNLEDMFLVLLFSSQPCESFFRLLRSLTTTQSTVVNFSMLELLQKVKRVETLLYVSEKLSASGYSLPSDKRKSLELTSSSKIFSLPSNQEIFSVIHQAYVEARIITASLGIPSTSPIQTQMNYLISMHKADLKELNDDSDEFLDLDVEDLEEDIPLDILAAFPESNAVNINSSNEPAGKPSDSRFVSFLDSKKKPITMRKSTFCWMLSTEGTSLSSDRLQRVKASVLQTVGAGRKKSSTSVVKKCHEIEVGDWCAFKRQKNIIYGQVLEFSYLSGKSKSYSLSKAPTTPPDKKTARGIGCLAVWFKVDSNGKLNVVPKLHYDFLSISNYVVTIPAPTSESGFLFIPQTIQDTVKS